MKIFKMIIDFLGISIKIFIITTIQSSSSSKLSASSSSLFTGTTVFPTLSELIFDLMPFLAVVVLPTKTVVLTVVLFPPVAVELFLLLLTVLVRLRLFGGGVVLVAFLLASKLAPALGLNSWRVSLSIFLMIPVTTGTASL